MIYVQPRLVVVFLLRATKKFIICIAHERGFRDFTWKVFIFRGGRYARTQKH